MTYISKNIKFLRDQRQMSYEQAAMMCNLPVDDFKKIESGIKEPTISQLMFIAEMLNYPIDRLLADNLEKMYYQLKSFEFKFLALDMDGVLTDCGMYYTESGDEFKKFNAKDGMAIMRMSKAGLPVGFISSGKNVNIMKNRAEMLGVKYIHMGEGKKIEVLESWCKEMNIGFENVAYIGDDVNDLQCIERCGLTACPADAVNLIKEKVHIVLSKKGGEGCVREFVEKYVMDIR